MKNIYKRLPLFIITVSLFILPVLIQAQQFQRRPPSGWFFSVGLGVVQIETEAMTQEKLQSYDDEPEKESAVLLWPMLGLSYLDEGGGQWFIGTLDETLGFESESWGRRR